MRAIENAKASIRVITAALLLTMIAWLVPANTEQRRRRPPQSVESAHRRSEDDLGLRVFWNLSADLGRRRIKRGLNGEF